MALTEQQKTDLLNEALDTRKVMLYCETHGYYGPPKDKTNTKVKPMKGCSKCWMVFYWHDLASTPPDKRAERLEELTEVLHKVVELVEKGKWDYKPYDKAQVEITKEYDA